jgi:hypothetical protein
MRVLLWAALAAAPVFAQGTGCSGTPAWSTCDLSFELNATEDAPNFELHAELRSPRQRTYLLTAFRESGHTYLVRFTPTESGDWQYRLTSNLARLNNKSGTLNAASSDAPGFVKAASYHHFATDNGQPHLWMATAMDGFAKMPRADFDALLDQRAKQKFTHVRVTLDPDTDLHEAAERIRAINLRGIVADLVLATIPEDAQARRGYITDIASRFSAFNITWMGVPAYEKLPHGRAELKDVGELLKKLDPYEHLRTSMADATSAPLGADQWETLRSYGTADPSIGAVEHQLFLTPAINTGIHSQADLWNATMNGQYPDSGDGAYMTAWYDLMSGTRHWELEPYFDVDGARAIALDGVDYIIYVEKPGPVEVTLKNHSYDVAWINPATGERTKAKDYKGEHFASEPPSRAHDWILHISREGHKASMLRSYKFDSRGDEDSEADKIQLQKVEASPEKVPFDVETPAETSNISLALPARFALKVKRDSRATRSLLVEWTAEVTVDGEGYRVVGTGREGTLQIARGLAHNLPASLLMHIAVMNANGKVYSIDNVYRLTP